MHQRANAWRPARSALKEGSAQSRHSASASRVRVEPQSIENQFWVEIRPLLVATIQRLPQRTIESIRPIPGTVSPCAARQAPLGPSSTTRIVQPSIVVGRVSGIAMGLGRTFARSGVAAAVGAMLFVVNGSLLAAALANCGLRERSCPRLKPLAPGPAALAAAPAIACRSALAPQAIS